MDSGRLGVVRRQENRHRKYICILNDVIKSRWEVIDQSIMREKFENEVKYDKSFVPWKRKYVHQRVLQQCLKMRKDAIERGSIKKQFGCYGGKPLYAFSRDINRFIADMHPKRRRERKVKKTLSESVQLGKILDPLVISERVQNHLKSWGEEESKQALPVRSERPESARKMFTKKTSLPPIRGIVNSFYSFNIKDDDVDDNGDSLGKESNKKTLNSNEKMSDNESKEALEPITDHSDTKSTQKKSEMNTENDRKGKLILPPIETAKSYVTGK